MTDRPVSYVGPMPEDEYLAAVEHIQQAMAIEPFRPPLIDVVKLLSDWRTLHNSIDQLDAINRNQLVRLTAALEERDAWHSHANTLRDRNIRLLRENIRLRAEKEQFSEPREK